MREDALKKFGKKVKGRMEMSFKEEGMEQARKRTKRGKKERPRLPQAYWCSRITSQIVRTSDTHGTERAKEGKSRPKPVVALLPCALPLCSPFLAQVFPYFHLPYLYLPRLIAELSF
jgi:hypothetical protein